MNRKSCRSVPRLARLAALAFAAAVCASGAFAFEPDGLKLGIRLFGPGRAALSVEWVMKEKGLRAEFGIWDAVTQPQLVLACRMYLSDPSFDEYGVTPFISLGLFGVGDLAKEVETPFWGGAVIGGGVAWNFSGPWTTDFAFSTAMTFYPDQFNTHGLEWDLAGRP